MEISRPSDKRYDKIMLSLRVHGAFIDPINPINLVVQREGYPITISCVSTVVC